MSQNKLTVQTYIDGFNKSDHAQILACLADDVEWFIPGFVQLVGKEAFDKEIENEAFVGRPTIQITRLTEENNVVIAEGSVRSAKRAGGFLNALFCDVFELEDARIKRLTSFLVEINEQVTADNNGGV